MRTSTPPAVKLKDYRPPAYRAETVDLHFDLNRNDTVVTARTLYRRSMEAVPDAALILDGEALELISVSLDGRRLGKTNYTVTSEGLVLGDLPERFELEIVTRINPEANTELSGLYRSGGNYCTQCEAQGFRRITYFQDRPDVLCVYSVRIEADFDEAPVLLGNGNPGRKGRLANNRHFAEWHDPHPKPSYLFALVGGRLDCLKGSFTTADGRKVRLGIHVQEGKREMARYAMDALKRSMRWDEERFGCLYDLDVFNIVAVPDFNMGAMENKGLNIFNDKYILADAQSATDTDFARIEAIIAHEYFHNWTGNRITCRDWFQLCLKEGLTVYRDQEFTSDMRSRAVKRIEDVALLRAHQFPEDAGPLAHPVRPESYREINNFYTATVYEKGAEIVRMLETLLDREAFDKSIRLYLDRHDGTAATVEEFLACFEEISGRDLSRFALWYSQAGTPRLQVSSSHDAGRKRFTVSIEQSVPPTPGQPSKRPMNMPIRIGLVGREGDLDVQSASGAQHRGDVFELDRSRHKIVFENVTEAPVLSINRGFSAPVEIRYDWSDRELLYLARKDSDPFNRWQAMRLAATREALRMMRSLARRRKPASPTAFCEAALEIASDRSLDPALRAEMLNLPGENEIAQAIGRNVDPEAIAAARRGLHAALGDALEPERQAIVASLGRPGTYRPDAAGAARRRLSLILLSAGLACGSEAAESEAIRLYDDADNMTAREGAFTLILRHLGDEDVARRVSTDFLARYRHNHIVLDKWFMHQAMAPVSRAPQIRALMRHEDFNWTNPNRVRALLHSFAAGNPAAFNRVNGEGHRLIASAVRRIDRTNPQLASRLLTVFRSWRMLEPQRRKQAEMALRNLPGARPLSRDVSDILERMLARN